jgi:hypothetical protein
MLDGDGCDDEDGTAAVLLLPSALSAAPMEDEAAAMVVAKAEEEFVVTRESAGEEKRTTREAVGRRSERTGGVGGGGTVEERKMDRIHEGHRIDILLLVREENCKPLRLLRRQPRLLWVVHSQQQYSERFANQSEWRRYMPHHCRFR